MRQEIRSYETSERQPPPETPKVLPPGPPKQDDATAKLINAAGWKQGSVFFPKGTKLEVPGDLNFDSANEVLMVCTHTCTVVSQRFRTDPQIEVVVGKTLGKYNPKAGESTGKNQRRLNIALTTMANGVAGIECDINRRFFFDRRLLAEITPNGEFDIGDNGSEKLAAWLSRNYNRITLPDLLVIRWRDTILALLTACLEMETSSGPVHLSIPAVYVDWQPRAEYEGVYKLRFFFLCNDSDIESSLGSALETSLALYRAPGGKDGIEITDIRCQSKDVTLVTDFDGYERLSDWDYLTGLEEIESFGNS